MNGWQNLLDYGFNQQKSRYGIVLTIASMLAVGIVFAWLSTRQPPKPCLTLGEDEIVYKEIDGKIKATLQLSRIPKGECVTIKPGM